MKISSACASVISSKSDQQQASSAAQLTRFVLGIDVVQDERCDAGVIWLTCLKSDHQTAVDLPKQGALGAIILCASSTRPFPLTN